MPNRRRHFLPVMLACAGAVAALRAGEAGDLTAGAARLDAETVVLRHGLLEAVVVTNGPTPWHGAGYNGIAKLTHRDEPEPLFIPFYAGLNFEHIFDGRDAGFAPRGGKLSLWRFGPHSVGIHRAAQDCPWGLASMTRFTLVDPHAIDVEFTAVPTRRAFAHNYVGMFWASYINQPRDRSMVFPGRKKDERSGPPRWIAATSPAHDVDSTHLATDEPAAWRDIDTRNWPGLAANFSSYTFDAPVFFGRVRAMTWIQMFERGAVSNNQTLRFSQSPVGGGQLNPAWDFHVVARDYDVGRPIRWRCRCIYKPYVNAADVMREYLAWSGRNDVPIPAAEPARGEWLPAAATTRKVVALSEPIQITTAGPQWVPLPMVVRKRPGEVVGVWFDRGGAGAANRYNRKGGHSVYWAVDVPVPKAGDELNFGRSGYAILTGYRTADAHESRRLEDPAGGDDGTSTGLVFDPRLQHDPAGDITAIWWHGYAGQTVRAAVLTAEPAAEIHE